MAKEETIITKTVRGIDELNKLRRERRGMFILVLLVLLIPTFIETAGLFALNSKNNTLTKENEKLKAEAGDQQHTIDTNNQTIHAITLERDEAKNALAPWVLLANSKITNAPPDQRLQLLYTSVLNMQGQLQNTLSQLKQIQNDMAQLVVERAPELSSDYPLGYLLFTVTDTKLFVPHLVPYRTNIVVHWERQDSYIEMDKENVSVHIPSVDGPLFSFWGSLLSFPRATGSGVRLVFNPASGMVMHDTWFRANTVGQIETFKTGPSSENSVYLECKVIATKRYGDMVVVGFNRYTGPLPAQRKQ